MTDYTQNITFATKDALSTGDPAKVIKGSDIDGEFSEIETASATKLDKYSAVTELTALDDAADMLSVYDNDATAYKRITVANARLALHPANGCYVEANLTTGMSLSDNTTYTVGDSTMAFTEVEDVGGDFDAATGIFTAPASGVYFCSYWATILVNAGNATENWYVLLKEAVTAGTWIHRGYSVNAGTGSGVNLSGGGAGVFTLSASDTLEIEVRHQTGTARTIGTSGGATGIQVMRIK